DDTPCATLEEFSALVLFPEYGQELIQAGTAALSRGEPIHPGLGHGDASKTSNYKGAAFAFRGQRWVVCETQLVNENAQLFDATVAYAAAVGAERSLAILKAPNAAAGGNSATDEYTARYRAAAWHGFGVVFVTEDRLHDTMRVAPTRPPSHQGWITDLVNALRDALLSREFDVERISGSKGAEELVRPVMDSLLVARGFRRAPTSRYQTFWRGAQSDGAWARDGTAPKLVALEVKLEEDVGGPFCQVIENLGRADAVIQVRLVNRKTRAALNELLASNPWVPELKARVAMKLPVRFLEIPAR
nr:hypothetical protein [Polyangiaceae bacterium]